MHSPGCAVGQGRNVYEHRHHGQSENTNNYRRFSTVISKLTGLDWCEGPSDRDWIVDGFRKDETQHGAGHKGRSQVRREVMMNEKLSAHQIEWEVVDCPKDQEEPGRVPKSVTNGCARSVSSRKQHKQSAHHVLSGIA